MGIVNSQQDDKSVITLTLLHPLQPVPVQSWTFKEEPQIRIGRSTNNEVVLYSAVVSRNHVEIRKVGQGWEVVNLGANGTYIDGKRVTQTLATDGMVMRLASSGPKILIKIDLDTASPYSKNNSQSSEESDIKKVKSPKETLIN
ncbi:Forkhead-associated protein [Hyella patelloides LEGE 07179]|uniref:Forkhead-associated protein n=1 Tax=Hyella patelloides LEGE 07179 TaxID=945734 RepID=A0A563W0S8_9CYAN|nr:FHA domain-containing protein [Hyella patelloides]VEP17276.1 Forkhead-associated protein [Hyella patelloides LEGE 07179]